MTLIRRIKGRRVREEEFRTKGGKAIQEQLQLLAGDFGVTIEDIQWDLRLISRNASTIATLLTWYTEDDPGFIPEVLSFWRQHEEQDT